MAYTDLIKTLGLDKLGWGDGNSDGDIFEDKKTGKWMTSGLLFDSATTDADYGSLGNYAMAQDKGYIGSEVEYGELPQGNSYGGLGGFGGMAQGVLAGLGDYSSWRKNNEQIKTMQQQRSNNKYILAQDKARKANIANSSTGFGRRV